MMWSSLSARISNISRTLLSRRSLTHQTFIPKIQLARYSSGCIKCGAGVEGGCGLCLIQCKSCSNLLPVSPDVTYYSLFCLPPVYSVDPTALRNQFLRLQRLLHPDNYPHAGADAKNRSENWSALLNQAYETLKDPQKRAAYLYKLKTGGEFVGEEGASDDVSELLAQVMEIRMELEECGEDRSIILGLAEDNRKRIEKVINSLEQAFSSKDWNHIRILLIHLRYWKTIQQAIDSKL